MGSHPSSGDPFGIGRLSYWDAANDILGYGLAARPVLCRTLICPTFHNLRPRGDGSLASLAGFFSHRFLVSTPACGNQARLLSQLY